MIAAIVSATLLLAAGADSWVGTVQVTGPAITRTVKLVGGGKAVRLEGELAAEIQRLASAKVEVVGTESGDSFEVSEYRIIDVGGGAKPLVGELLQTSKGLALRDGGGTPIPLTMPARSQARLSRNVGAKVWVYGTKLVSGELKVLRYGILKAPPPAPRQEPTPADKQP